MSEKVGEIYYDVGADIAPLLQGSTQAKAALDSMGKGADKASNSMDGLERSAQKTGKAVARSANDASQASKVMESLGNQVAILEEKQQNGARAAVVLAAELQAGSQATASQRKEIASLAGQLYDLKSAQDAASSSTEKATASSGRMEMMMNRVGLAIAGAFTLQAAGRIISIADQMSILQARVERLSPSIEVAKSTMASLSAIAAQTGSSLDDTERLWEKLTQSLKSAGVSNSQILALTETLQKIGTVGGSSSEEMSLALRQFGQSLDGGIIRAEEFNSIIEQMPELARQMAAGLGISVGDLRKRMLEGKLTAEDALNAIRSQAGKVSEEFDKMPSSVERAKNSLDVAFKNVISDLNESIGLTRSLAGAMTQLSNNLNYFNKNAGDAGRLPKLLELQKQYTSEVQEGQKWWETQSVYQQRVGQATFNLKNTEAEIRSIRAASTKELESQSKIVIPKSTTDSKEAKDLEKKSQRRLELSKLEGQAKARLQAQYDAEDAGITDSKRVKALQDEYAATEKNTSATKAGNAEARKSASQAESVTQKLEALRAKSEQVGDTTKELSRAQAILAAEQSLGKGATDTQIEQAGKYAAKIWDQNNALKQQAQIKQGMKFAQQEIAASEVMPDARSGAVQNPTAQIDLQEKQKLEALAKYQALDVQNAQLYEDAKTAIQRQAANARQQIAENEANMQSQAISSIIGSVSQGLDGLANLAAGAAGKSSGAYQAMFALSKGFAVAQAALNLQLAISQAMADPTALTPAQKFANYAAIASAGASLLSSIGSISYGGGREHGGPVNANSMYRVGEGGKPEIFKASNGSQYMIPGDSGRVISNRDLGGSGVGNGGISMTFQFDIQTTGGIDEATQKQMAQMMQTVAIRTIKDQQRPRGLLAPSK
ncbi:tape measure protein [Pantoea sp. ACRSB]|uniref:tape measure protein n=1 Tax=Pantoea sp. ACRSB TaxID=2918207 RepID=UPI002892EE6D|nr:tape measure protein [Pantoea sp. ACRSB]MCG7388291.1 tape measure protein [Pantoea sp. ACRSB]